MHGRVFEVERCCLKDIGAKFFPCLRFGKDGSPKRARAVAALLGVANFEDEFHALRIPEAEIERSTREMTRPGKRVWERDIRRLRNPGHGGSCAGPPRVPVRLRHRRLYL